MSINPKKPDNNRHLSGIKHYMKGSTSTSSYDTIATLLSSLSESASDVNAMLQTVAQYYDADRAYVFEMTQDRAGLNNTYEWCREGISPEIENLQNISFEGSEAWFREFEENGAFCFSSLDKDTPMFELLEPQGIKSLSVVPLYLDSEITGFIGVDNPRKHVDNLTVLKTVASILSSDIIRNLAEKRSRELVESAKNRFFADTFLDTFESAYYVNLEDDSFLTLRQREYLHENYGKQTSWTEIANKYADEGINPEDKPKFSVICSLESLREQIEREDSFHTVFRDTYMGHERFCRLYVLRGEDMNHAAVGFMDVDDKTRAEETTAIISSMAEDFDYIACVNPYLRTVTRYRATDKFNRIFSMIDDSLPANLRMDAFFRMCIHPDDWKYFMDECSLDKVSAALDRGEVYKFECRTLEPFTGKEEYYRFKFAHVPNNPDLVIFGMLDVDTLVRREMEMEILKKNQELDDTTEELKHSEFRADVLAYFADNEGDPIEFLRAFADRLRVMLGCDQIIYRDLTEVKVMINSPAIEKTWAVPMEYCLQCQHLDPFHHMYRNGVTEMSDCAKGFEGIPTFSKCPIKSSLTRIVYVNGEVGGYIAIHYVVNYHDFTQLERDTLMDFTIVFSMALSRYEARNKNRQLESELSLREQLDQYNKIVNALAEEYSSVYVVNLSDSSVYVAKLSGRMNTMFGDTFRKSDYVKSYNAYVDTAVSEGEKEEMRRVFSVDYIREHLSGVSSFVKYYINNDGEYTEMKVVKTTDDDEVVMGFGVKDAEIREQLAMTEEMKRNNTLVSILSEDYISIFALNLDTGESKVVSTPKKREFTAGLIEKYTLHDALIKYCETAVHPDDREQFKKIFDYGYIREKLAHSKRFRFTYRVLVDGEYRYQDYVAGKEGDPDSPVSMVAVGFQDVNERVRNEKAQEEAIKQALVMAQSANRAKTTFLNNMSHDIRTPMNAIIGYTGLAASHIDNKELLQDYLKKIGQSSDHLLSLINDVLDMSRIESGKMNIDEKPENLSEIMHTLRNIVQTDIKAKELDFFMDTADVLNEEIICDKLRLNQVLLNVLSNAIKYTQPGGTISLRIIQKAVSSSGYGEYEFRVKDNGMGMSEEFLKTIFDPFTRVQSSTVSGIQGTGLGMAITKNIVDMMGGTIDIVSKEGEGTEVAVTFKFKLGEAQQKVERIVELDGLRSLVVDDDMNACMSISKMLRECGLRSEWCASGKEAVVRTQEALKIGDLFKVYIIDWLMPDMNGIETTRRIRRLVGDEAPIVILTAYDWSDIEEEAREAGVTAFISKPLFPSDLHSILEKCVGKEIKTEEDASEDYDFTGRRILLVDDNEMNREIAQEILEEAGFVVDTAEDGDIAVEKIRLSGEDDYDLVLMDIQMPRMDGYESTRQIRQIPPLDKHIPIIAMTANAFEEDRKAAFEAGMDEHIAKPIDVKILKKTLAKYI